MQCSICLDDLEGGPTLACGHRFHASCLARLAGANGTTPTRRGALTTCPAPKVIVDAPDERCPAHKRRAERPGETVELTGMHGGKTVEGATQKLNGKWTNNKIFPGREFDDLDAYRAAKKQRVEQRAARSGQLKAWRPGT